MSLKLRTIAANQTEITLASGAVIFFSYQTPVAAFVPGRGYIRTVNRYSTTTSRHISQWLPRAGQGEVETVPQSEIEALT